MNYKLKNDQSMFIIPFLIIMLKFINKGIRFHYDFFRII